MTVDVLLLMEITSVFVLRDLMVQNVKVTKSQFTVKLKQKMQSPCLIKDYRNAEITRSLCVYVDGPRNNMDMTDRTQCLHEYITDCNY